MSRQGTEIFRIPSITFLFTIRCIINLKVYFKRYIFRVVSYAYATVQIHKVRSQGHKRCDSRKRDSIPII